eukprot:5639214-Pleurochrysis_carterae.AAC.2
MGYICRGLSTGAWGPKGRVHTLLADSLTQEARVVQAAAEVMHDGNHAGQVAVVLPTSLLQRYVGELKTKRVLLGVKRAGSNRAGPARQVAEIVRVAQLLRCSRKQLLLEFTNKYADADGRPLTVAELVAKHQKEDEKFDDERSTLAAKVLRAQDCARQAKACTQSRVDAAVKKAEKQLEGVKKRGKAQREFTKKIRAERERARGAESCKRRIGVAARAARPSARSGALS